MQEGDGTDQFRYTPTNPVATHPIQPQTPVQQINPKPEASIRWQASEFVDHEKDNSWFILLGAAAIVVSVVVYLMSKSIFSSIVIFFAAAAFGVTAKQRPRTLQYSLLPTGVQVGEKRYRYDDFRSFSVVQEGALWSIILQPTKRFMPTLTIYIDPNDGEKIFDVLATQMPHEEHTSDSIDRFMKRIRF